MLILAFLISFLTGAIAGVITFAGDFTDKPIVLIKSGWCLAYGFFNGCMASLIFTVFNKLNIEILSLSIKDAPILLSAIVGLSWYIFLNSPIFTGGSGALTSQSMSGLFLQIKKYMYHHYSMNQMTLLRPKVWDIVEHIKNDDFYDFFILCVNLAKGISAEKGMKLGESYSQYKENNSNVQDYKCSISTDIAKIIGIQLLEQVAKELEIRNTPISNDIEQLNDRLKSLRKIHPGRLYKHE